MMNTPDLGQRAAVLLVDDSPETLVMLTDALETAGITVLVASNGYRALSLLERVTPSVILMDAVMPGMDGFETCHHIKQRKDWADIPVIFMTGLTDTEHIVRGLEAGGVDYVTKPVVVAELLARMRVHLSNARVAAGACAALDATGRHMLAVDATGKVLWQTPQAAQLLAELELQALSAQILERLGIGSESGQASCRLATPRGELDFARLAQPGPNEYLLSITCHNGLPEEQMLQQELGLTQRQAEVLLWLTRGKTNREIGLILDTSPRTVNKHLEQIFEKLQVDNRTSAAIAGLKVLEKV